MGEQLSLYGWIGCGCILLGMIAGGLRLSRLYTRALTKLLRAHPVVFRVMLQFNQSQFLHERRQIHPKASSQTLL